MDQANTVTYEFVSNSLAAEAASLGDHPPRGVLDVNTCGDKAPERGVKGSGGVLFNGFYSNWSKLSDEEKKSIFGKRELLNINGRGKRNYHYKKKQSRVASIKSKKKAAQKIQHNISYLKANFKELEEKRRKIGEADKDQDNVGNQF